MGDPILAYIDPGSGSIIFQAVIGGIMAAGLAAKVYWRKMRSLFRRHG
jgi:hypothetical protein